VKIYAAAVKALKKKERQDETLFTKKIDAFLSFFPPLNPKVYFFQVCFESDAVYDQTQESGVVFSLIYGTSGDVWVYMPHVVFFL
jgi:hypothetical protein